MDFERPIFPMIQNDHSLRGSQEEGNKVNESLVWIKYGSLYLLTASLSWIIQEGIRNFPFNQEYGDTAGPATGPLTQKIICLLP